ncbi:hypothetical protein MKJ04_13545 [Pontibacter sp. E15-1]|uniref:hypothetical protein n=1 Tax=Pontibacter sp. E15-1 TaxID=2919918 RepID=UPI001F4F4EB2|nr:hypothetical protein [Pontibacter sp. E15-1]MCJ8165870.1 hypothetical protein [Pontibacter sp. E15-1]
MSMKGSADEFFFFALLPEAEHAKVKVKNHGYKANSFFRTGLDKIREMLRMKAKEWHQKIETFIRWINRQIQHYQNTTILVG